MKLNLNSLNINDFTYYLPEDKIAKYPLERRENSKLMVYKHQNIEISEFALVSNFLPSKSLLIFNNTKVIQARLQFQKSTGALIEIFCLEPFFPHDYNLIFQATNSCQWKCIVGNLKRWKNDELFSNILINDENIVFSCKKVTANNDDLIIEFNWNNSNISFGDIIQAFGKVPIPPYLNRNSEEIDKERYQTVYSKTKGSVAAPTAGLHFTKDFIDNLNKQGFENDEITLHVGAGTFKPVKSELIQEHEMHSEHFFIELTTLRNLKAKLGSIVSVGTTSLRTLESLYWLGVKFSINENLTAESLRINQWDAYNLPSELSAEEAINRIIFFLEKNELTNFHGVTQIMIVPGYQFKIVNGLITNFHQPQSTLLLLIAAFVGKDWKLIYEAALSNNFRFLSYGDSSYLER